MTKTETMPGPCGMIATICADGDDEGIKLEISTQCKAINALAAELGPSVEPYKLCLPRKGQNLISDELKARLGIHQECPVVTAIIRTVAVEAKLALKKDVYIRFIDE